MKILHLVPPTFGGIDMYVFNHYKYMDQKKFQFDFLTLNPGLKTAPQYQNYQYEVRMLPAAAAENRDGFIRAVQDILHTRYDALHLHTSHWTGTLIEEIGKEAGIPKIIIHAHTTNIEETNEERRNFLLQQHERIKRGFSPELATDFWACSRKAGDWLFGEQIPREWIQIMKNAIEPERYRFNKERRNRIRRELGIEESTVLGTVGRMAYSKNHMFLIDVFSKFHKNHPNAKLLIVGDGELKGNLQQRICEKHLENVVLLPGWKANVTDYLQAMDCFLLPSRFEGLGIAALEAAASGLPCVVSDQVPEELSFTEKIRHAPLQVSAWVSELSEVVETPVDRESGVEIIQAAGYDVRQQAKVLESMYRS